MVCGVREMTAVKSSKHGEYDLFEEFLSEDFLSFMIYHSFLCPYMNGIHKHWWLT